MAKKSNRNLVSIVIPIYKETVDIIDTTSLQSLKDTIGLASGLAYDVKLMCPEGLDTTEVKKILGTKDVEDITFDPKYFTGASSYSRLLESPEFYQRFAGYEYILIFQTDCLMLEDSLTEWCNKGYDYVGAPIISNHHVWKTAPTTGNGGLSLRKVSKFIELTTTFHSSEFQLKYSGFFLEWVRDIEDLFFCEYLYQFLHWNRPRPKAASGFAFDMNPDNVFVLAGNKLPMGAHAWDKNIWWWKKYVPFLNNPDLITFCEDKWLNETKTGVGAYCKMMRNRYVE